MDIPEHAVFVVPKGKPLKINRITHTVQKREVVVNFFKDITVLLWLNSKEGNRSRFFVATQERGAEEITLTGYDAAPEVVKEGDRVFRCNNTLYKVASNPDVTVWSMADGYVMTMYKASHPTKGRLLVIEIHGRLEAFDFPVTYSPEAVFG